MRVYVWGEGWLEPDPPVLPLFSPSFGTTGLEASLLYFSAISRWGIQNHSIVLPTHACSVSSAAWQEVCHMPIATNFTQTSCHIHVQDSCIKEHFSAIQDTVHASEVSVRGICLNCTLKKDRHHSSAWFIYEGLSPYRWAGLIHPTADHMFLSANTARGACINWAHTHSFHLCNCR